LKNGRHAQSSCKQIRAKKERKIKGKKNEKAHMTGQYQIEDAN
jgi:hypothetical protein